MYWWTAPAISIPSPWGGICFGTRNRFTPYGLEVETLTLPDNLFARLRETEAALHQIV